VAAHAVLAVVVVVSYGTASLRARGSRPILLATPPTVLQAVALPPLAEPPPSAPARGPLEIPATVTPADPAAPAPAADTASTLFIGPTVPGPRPAPLPRGAAAYAPRFGDARVWAASPIYVEAGSGRTISMDSVVRSRLLFMAANLDVLARRDSLSPLEDEQLRAPSWTVERNGRRYGIDQQAIHFGTFSIPTAVLALIPMNLPQGNVDQQRANRRLAEMRAEILRAAARAEAEDDFDRAVREIRARWRRDREERMAREREQREGQPQGEDRPRP